MTFRSYRIRPDALAEFSRQFYKWSGIYHKFFLEIYKEVSMKYP
jgi:hypothetical protein